jgi:CHRD domain
MLGFMPGQRSKQVRVSVLDDAEPEAEETFFLRLSRARGARIRRSRATAVIRASDLPPPFTLQAALTGEEQLPGPGSPTGRGTATITFDATGEVASFVVTISGVERPMEAGIGRGRRGEAPTTNVLRFTDQFPASGTLIDSKRLELVSILELYRDPGGFFVEVRSATGVGSGGIRGQLARAS